MIALCASLLILCTASLLQATDNLEAPKNTAQTEQSQDAQNSSKNDSLKIKLDEATIQKFAMMILGLQALADKHGVDFETQDFVDTIKWKAFAKHYGIKATAPEFCAHLMQTKNNDAQWALFCQKHTNVDRTITPTELCSQLLKTIKLKKERNSKLKWRALPFFTLLGATGGTIGTWIFTTYYDQITSAAKGVTDNVGFLTLKYMPNIIEKCLENSKNFKKIGILKKYKLNDIARKVDDLFALEGEQLKYIIALKPLSELKQIAASCNLECSGMQLNELQEHIASHLINDIQGIKGKTWSMKGVPIITRDQLISNVLAKSIGDGIRYKFEDTREFTKGFALDWAQTDDPKKFTNFNNQSISTTITNKSYVFTDKNENTCNIPIASYLGQNLPHLMKLKSPETAIKINQPYTNDLNHQCLDSTIIFGANLMKTIVNNVGNHAIENIEDKPIIAFKNGTFIILSTKGLVGIMTQSTQEFGTYALYSQLSANKSKSDDDCSKLKLNPKDFFILFGVNAANEVTYNIVSHLGSHYLPEYLPRNGKPQNMQQVWVKKGVNLAVERILTHPKKYAELAAPMAIRYAPDAIRWQLLANNSPDKEWGIKCIDVITQTLSDIANHNVRIVVPDKNKKFDHFTSLTKHHHSTQAGQRNVTSAKDCVIFLSRRLAGKALDNLADNVIRFTPRIKEDKPLIKWKNSNVPVITSQQAVHVLKKSAEDCVAHALLSKLESNQRKTNEDATKKKALTPTDVASIISLHTTNEVLYNFIARVGSMVLPEYFPENGTPKTAIQAEVKDTVQKVTPFVLIPALKLVGKGIMSVVDPIKNCYEMDFSYIKIG